MLQPYINTELQRIQTMPINTDVMDNMFVKNHIEQLGTYQMPGKQDTDMTMLAMPIIKDSTNLVAYGAGGA